jgi:hypothetical protein
VGSDQQKQAFNRRDLLKAGAAVVGAGLVAPTGADTGVQAERPGLGPAPEAPFAAPPIDVVRVGFVGVGLQGSSHCRNLLRIPNVELKALCDIVPEKVERVAQWVVESGQPKPAAYTRGERDFERLCETEELDLVYTATPWEWHVPVLVAAMKNGKHAATEVPAAITLDECGQMVEHAEKYGKHCVMMENCNYDRPEMMVFNMVRQGLFGEILHGECGYLHDLRAIKFEDKDEGLWRRAHSRTRNGNLYPTHGLGPVANCMDINRGDRFDYLVSMSGPSRGLQLWAEEHFPEGAPQRRETFVLGDVNVSLIHTAAGRTIFLSHNTNSPRPYSRIHLVQGTRGLFQGYPNRVYIEGRSPEDRWEDAEAYVPEFEHPLWKAIGGSARQAGHGGMDYLEDHRLIKCLREGLATDMNVYDAAAISAVCELTERSVAGGSRPMPFPDFTRGRWQTWPKLGLVTA